MALELNEDMLKAKKESGKTEGKKSDSGKVKLTKEEKIAKLAEKKKQIEAKMKQLQARDVKKERKEDARKKIILGGLVLSMMEKDADLKTKIENALKGSLIGKREKDKELFNLN